MQATIMSVLLQSEWKFPKVSSKAIALHLILLPKLKPASGKCIWKGRYVYAFGPDG